VCAAFTVLGSSSGLPQAERACSGYCLQSDDSLSIIDCGGGVTRSFLQSGFDPMKLDRIFLSHTHSDHCCELTLLIQMLHVMKSERRLELHVPDEFVRFLYRWLNAVYLFPQHIKPKLEIHGYADGFVYNGGSCTLRAIANEHLTKAAEIIEQYDVPNQMQCHSLRIETERKKLLYSADVDSLDDIWPHLDGLDYALVESTHIDLARLFDRARETPSTHYVLTHLGSGEELSRLHERIRDAGLDNMMLATDGLRLEM